MKDKYVKVFTQNVDIVVKGSVGSRLRKVRYKSFTDVPTSKLMLVIGPKGET